MDELLGEFVELLLLEQGPRRFERSEQRSSQRVGEGVCLLLVDGARVGPKDRSGVGDRAGEVAFVGVEIEVQLSVFAAKSAGWQQGSAER